MANTRHTTAYNLINFIYRLFVYKPWHVLTLLLLIQIVNKKEDVAINSNLSAYNQCPLPDNTALFENFCYLEDELVEFYHIEKNVPSLRDVVYFMFMEFHNNALHHDLKVRFTNLLGGLGDGVYFEGLNATQTYPCDGFIPEHAIQSLKINHKFVCHGWDNEELRIQHHSSYVFYVNAYLDGVEFNRLHEQCENMTAALLTRQDLTVHDMAMLRKLLKELVSYKKYYKALDTIDLYSWDFTSNFSHTLNRAAETLTKVKLDFEQDFLEIAEETGRLTYQMLVVRNRAAIGTLEKFSYKTHRSFYFFGASHLLAKTNCEETDCFFAVEKNNYQYEIRKALEQVPHAILMPKNR